MTEIYCITVRFSLPAWVMDERFDHDDAVMYPSYHRYAGTFSHRKLTNQIADGLFRLKYTKTTCLLSPWVEAEFECKPEDLVKHVKVYQGKLNRYLGRFRESRLEAA